MARSFINCFLALSLVVFAAFGLACTDTGTSGPLIRPTSGLVIELYASTLQPHSIPVVTCTYTSNQFPGSRDCGLVYVGGTGMSGFTYSSPMASVPNTVTVSAMVSVNGAIAVSGMCDNPNYLDGDAAFVASSNWSYAQSESSPTSQGCEVRFSNF